MRLDELPKHIATAIKGVRTITVKSLGRVLKGKNGKNLCRWCRGPLAGRRTSWCGSKCTDSFLQLQSCGSSILDRDKGRCQSCNCDVLEMEYILKSWKYKVPAEQAILLTKHPDWFKNGGLRFKTPYQVDHVKPLHLLGTSTSCNLRILCSLCHIKKSSKEASSRAKKKRATGG